VSEVEKTRPPRALGECDLRPSAIVVHNPVTAGAFHAFDRIGDDNRLESELLFRERPHPQLYSEHHDILVRKIATHVDRVFFLTDLIGLDPPVDHLAAHLADNPNQVFTRDSLITLPWAPDAYFCAQMKPSQRRRESQTMKLAAERLGLREIMRLPEGTFLEGGDLVPFVYEEKRCLLVGYGPRSTPEAIDFLQASLIPEFADELIAIQLAPWRMNLDGGFVPLADDVIVSDTKSIISAQLIDAKNRVDIDIWEMLRDLGIRVIDTTPDESIYLQSCNCLCLGDREIVYYDLCPRVAALINRNDITVHTIPGAELIKGRGGPRCMTRPIYLPQT
jgi:N-dimethylarginine dimethylaminohydrolase